jgi:uncharacterized membrane protein
MPPAMLTVLILALATAGLAACGRSEQPTEPPQQVRPPTAELDATTDQEPPQDLEALIEAGTPVGSFSFEAYAYDCDGMQVAVRPGDGEVTLMLPDRSIVLPQVEAASGARYADADNAFWGKGVDSGLLSLDGEDVQCALNRSETPWVDARARGAVFRGLGQEPGWHLEIHAERIVMVYQYGQRRVVVPNSGSIADPDYPRRRWQATTEAHELTVVVEDRACTDVMSGETYPASVAVTLDGRDYSGCGRDLD